MFSIESTKFLNMLDKFDKFKFSEHDFYESVFREINQSLHDNNITLDQSNLFQFFQIVTSFFSSFQYGSQIFEPNFNPDIFDKYNSSIKNLFENKMYPFFFSELDLEINKDLYGIVETIYLNSTYSFFNQQQISQILLIEDKIEYFSFNQSNINFLLKTNNISKFLDNNNYDNRFLAYSNFFTIIEYLDNQDNYYQKQSNFDNTFSPSKPDLSFINYQYIYEDLSNNGYLNDFQEKHPLFSLKYLQLDSNFINSLKEYNLDFLEKNIIFNFNNFPKLDLSVVENILNFDLKNNKLINLLLIFVVENQHTHLYSKFNKFLNNDLVIRNFSNLNEWDNPYLWEKIIYDNFDKYSFSEISKRIPVQIYTNQKHELSSGKIVDFFKNENEEKILKLFHSNHEMIESFFINIFNIIDINVPSYSQKITQKYHDKNVSIDIKILYPHTNNDKFLKILDYMLSNINLYNLNMSKQFLQTLLLSGKFHLFFEKYHKIKEKNDNLYLASFFPGMQNKEFNLFFNKSFNNTYRSIYLQSSLSINDKIEEKHVKKKI